MLDPAEAIDLPPDARHALPGLNRLADLIAFKRSLQTLRKNTNECTREGIESFHGHPVNRPTRCGG